jgi:phage-related protein
MSGTGGQRTIPVFFYRTRSGNEPVRDWLRNLDEADRRAIGLDLLRVQTQWPIGMPVCRSLGGGLWEVRSNLPSHRIARILFCIDNDEIYVVHGFVKKTQATPASDLELARTRMKEVRS